MSKKMKEIWEEAEKTGEPVPVGDLVVCDICSEDYTNSPDTGGFIFCSKAYCPKCAEEGMKSIRHYGEEGYIRAICPPGASFADFVRDYRGPNSFVQVTGPIFPLEEEK